MSDSRGHSSLSKSPDQSLDSSISVSTSTTHSSNVRHARASILVAVIFLCLWMPWIGGVDFWGSSEAREAHVMQSILREESWLFPTRNGISPSKPPLHHMIGAFISLPFGGVSEGSARVASVLAAALVLGFFSYLGSLLGIAPFLTFTVVATLYGFVALVGDAMVDMTFTFFVTTATLSLLWHTLVSSNPANPISNKQYLCWALFSGLAVLTKGPLGWVLPHLFAGVFFLSQLGFKAAFAMLLRPRVWHALALCIGSAWYIALFINADNHTLGRQLWFENLHRFLGGENVNKEPFWFYLPSLIQKAFPWSFIFLFVVYKDFIARNTSHQAKTRLSLSYAVFACILFFSFAAGKRHSYLLPLFPWISLIIAWWVAQHKAFHRIRRALLVVIPVSLLCCLFIGVGAYLGLYPTFINEAISLFVINYSVPLGALLVLLVTLHFNRHQAAASFATAAILSALITFGLFVKSYGKNYRGQANVIRDATKDCPLTVVRSVYDESLDVVLYYLQRKVPIVDPASATLIPGTVYLSSAKIFGELLSKQDARVLTQTEGRVPKPGTGAVVSYVGNSICHNQ